MKTKNHRHSLGETPSKPFKNTGWKVLLARFSDLQSKLIVPYVLLSLVLAMGGTYIVTRLVTSSIRERFVNQLYEASRIASDSIVRQERFHLETLRLMVFSEGVWEAVKEQDGDRIQELLMPLALNNNVDFVSAISGDGREIITLGKALDSKDYFISSGADLSSEYLVSNILEGKIDDQGDKYIQILETGSGMTLCTSAPIRNDAEDLAGVMIVGTHLDNLLSLIKSQALADIIILQPERGLIATTLIEPDEGFGELEAVLQNVTDIDLSTTKEITLNQRRYQVIHSPLVARSQPLGIMGVALPSNYLVSTEATNRNSFAILFSITTLGIIVIGYLLSQSIARPILKLRSLSQEVAAGNLNQSVDIERTDEIGDLAKAFDKMTFNLRERTEETARLYAESLQRNQELATMYEQLKTTQAQLIQSEKLAAVGQLTAGIVHDIKSPLMVIMGLAEFLAVEENLTEDGIHQLGIMRESAVKANQIVQDLLKFSRQSQPEMQLSDMRETVDAALRLTDYLTRKAQINVIKELPDTPLRMTYDPQQVEQVLINLITNAVHAMSEGGSLHIMLRQRDNIAAIAVEDTGAGIPPEIITRIFDPFFTTKPEGVGTGLGLSVSYGIIACHNGKIEVESEIGKGTTFTVLIPTNLSQNIIEEISDGK